jgi:rubrerythrin
MAEYIERTEELMLAMNAGSRAIENTKRYHGAVYTKDVFSESPQEIPYLQAAKVLREVSDAPAADVAPVVHGHFVHDGPRFAGGVDWWRCSACGGLASGAETQFAYCPNCGAKMDGGVDNETD